MNRRAATFSWPLLIPLFAGAVVLAFADAPQSLGMVFRAGIDTPETIGEQLAIVLAGALATALAVLLARWWRWLLPGAALGVLVAHLVYNPAAQGLTMRVAEAGEAAVPPEFVRELPWVCLDVASAGVLLVAVLASAQRLHREHRSGAVAAAVIGCAGYLGPSLVGPLRSAETATARLVVLALAVVLTGATLLSRETADPEPPRPLPLPAQLIAAVAVVATAIPTVLVAVTGENTFGTAVGGVAGLAVAAAAVAAALQLGGNALLATGAAALALAAPAAIVFFIADALVVDATGLLGLVGVAIAAAAAFGRSRYAAAAGVLGVTALLFVLLASGIVSFASSVAIGWAVVIACIASSGAAFGATAPLLAKRAALPAAGAVVTAFAVGVHGAMNFFRIGPDLRMVFEWPGLVLTAGLLAVAAGLLLVLRKQDRVQTTGPLGDYRRVFTATEPAPPETR